MRFEQPLIEGTLVRRHKRFVADVVLDNGETVSVHCVNPGSLLGCSDPGSKVLVSESNSPRLRFKHQLEIVYAGRTPVGIHTGRPVAVVAEAVAQSKIPELAGYATLRRDTNPNRGCRIDLIVDGNGLRRCFMQVINVTMARESAGLFPDAHIKNGVETMQVLTNLVREGNRVMVLFVVQRADVEAFRLADDIDPDFTQCFRDAVARGVETICYRSRVTRRGIELDCRLDMDMSEN